MAKENIAGFVNAAMTEKALAEKLAALASENGFEFTAEELLELGSARPIDDADMENAAGGVNGLPPEVIQDYLKNHPIQHRLDGFRRWPERPLGEIEE